MLDPEVFDVENGTQRVPGAVRLWTDTNELNPSRARHRIRIPSNITMAYHLIKSSSLHRKCRVPFSCIFSPLSSFSSPSHNTFISTRTRK